MKHEQRRLYELLAKEVRCFVHICDDDSALWVSDFSRKCENSADAQARLLEAGFTVRADEASRLWYIDWTMARWQEKLAPFVKAVPSFPDREALHEAYALCRLLLAHPAPLEAEQLPMIRRVLKLTGEPPERMKKAVRALAEETAELLREQKKIAHAAGWILAAWLNEQSDRKETQL